MNGYRCYICYVDSNGGERIYDTVEFFPKKVAMPELSEQYKATNVIIDIITILRNLAPAIPFLEYVPAATTTIEQISDIFLMNATPEQLYLPDTPTVEPNQDTSPAVTTPQADPRVTMRRHTIAPPRVQKPKPSPEPKPAPTPALEIDTTAPPRVPPVPHAPYPLEPPAKVTLTEKVKNSIIEEIQKDRPFHAHKHRTCLSTRQISRFSLPGENCQ